MCDFLLGENMINDMSIIHSGSLELILAHLKLPQKNLNRSEVDTGGGVSELQTLSEVW